MLLSSCMEAMALLRGGVPGGEVSGAWQHLAARGHLGPGPAFCGLRGWLVALCSAVQGTEELPENPCLPWCLFGAKKTVP